MAFHKSNDTGSVNAWRAHVSTAMKKVAASKTCPNCQRGNALGAKHIFVEDGFSVRKCRYCGYEHTVKF